MCNVKLLNLNLLQYHGFLKSAQLAYDERPMSPVPFLQARLLIEVGVVGHKQEAPA